MLRSLARSDEAARLEEAARSAVAARESAEAKAAQEEERAKRGTPSQRFDATIAGFREYADGSRIKGEDVAVALANVVELVKENGRSVEELGAKLGEAEGREREAVEREDYEGAHEVSVEIEGIKGAWRSPLRTFVGAGVERAAGVAARLARARLWQRQVEAPHAGHDVVAKYLVLRQRLRAVGPVCDQVVEPGAGEESCALNCRRGASAELAAVQGRRHSFLTRHILARERYPRGRRRSSSCRLGSFC